MHMSVCVGVCVCTCLSGPAWTQEAPALPDDLPDGVFYQRTHPRTNERVVVRRRADRQPLVSLYIGKSQCAQVIPATIGGEGVAVAMLVLLARGYVSDTYTRAQLKEDPRPLTCQ